MRPNYTYDSKIKSIIDLGVSPCSQRSGPLLIDKARRWLQQVFTVVKEVNRNFGHFFPNNAHRVIPNKAHQTSFYPYPPLSLALYIFPSIGRAIVWLIRSSQVFRIEISLYFFVMAGEDLNKTAGYPVEKRMSARYEG